MVRQSLTLLSLAAGTAATRFLSLASFQLITAPNVPMRCIIAYNSMIIGCTITDFLENNLCSSECVEGVEEADDNIDEACAGVDVDEDTLLGAALRGELVDLLCPGQGGGGGGQQPISTITRRTSTEPTQIQTSATLISRTTDASEFTSTTTSSDQILVSSPPGTFPSTTTVIIQPPPTNQPQPDDGGDDDDNDDQEVRTDSGGGSPFDEPASPAVARGASSALAGVAALLAGLALLR